MAAARSFDHAFDLWPCLSIEVERARTPMRVGFAARVWHARTARGCAVVVASREMAARRPEGTALLVAGHGALGVSDASALHTLGQIGEALLATGAAWQIRRLASTAGARYAPDRGALK